MSGYRPAHIYAKINTTPELSKNPNEGRPKSITMEATPNQGNEIQVSSCGQLSLQPDQCKLTVNIHSKKETAQDAKNSVSRRVDYILQTLNNHQVKVGMLSKLITSTKEC